MVCSSFNICIEIPKIWLCASPPVFLSPRTTRCRKVCTKHCQPLQLGAARARHFTRGSQQTLRIPWSRGSSVSVVTRLRTGRSGVWLPERTKRFLFCSERPDRSWDTPCLLSNSYRTFFAGGKVAGAWNQPVTPSSSGVRNGAVPISAYRLYSVDSDVTFF